MVGACHAFATSYSSLMGGGGGRVLQGTIDGEGLGRVWLNRFADYGFGPKNNCGFLFRSKFLSNLRIPYVKEAEYCGFSQ